MPYDIFYESDLVSGETTPGLVQLACMLGNAGIHWDMALTSSIFSVEIEYFGINSLTSETFEPSASISRLSLAVVGPCLRTSGAVQKSIEDQTIRSRVRRLCDHGTENPCFSMSHD